MLIAGSYRGHGDAHYLIEQANADSKIAAFTYLNLCADWIEHLQRYGFSYSRQGFLPWQQESRIYQIHFGVLLTLRCQKIATADIPKNMQIDYNPVL